MALLSAAWLSPKDPRGTTVWGSVGMTLMFGALYWVHGQADEVWPNRCALLRAQLIDQAPYERVITLPELESGLRPPQELSSIQIEPAQRVALPQGGPALTLRARSSLGQLFTGELYTLDPKRLGELRARLGVEAQPAAHLAELTRQGLKVSPSALTCALQFSSTEQSLALALLLKPGLQDKAPEGLEGFGLYGARGWYARWRAGSSIQWRLWAPLNEPEGDREWLMVWTSYPPREAQAADQAQTSGGLSALDEALNARTLPSLTSSLRSLTLNSETLEGLRWLEDLTRGVGEQ